MILYVFFVAALNLGLGFGIAVYLSRQYRARAIVAESPAQPTSGWANEEDPWAEEPKDEPAAMEEPAEIAAPAEPPPAAEEIVAETTPEPPAEPEPEAQTTPAEESVANLQSEAQQFNKQVVEADDLLRACAEDPQTDDLQAILGSLAESTRQYLERREVEGTLKNLSAEGEEISDELRGALERQDEQIGETSAMIDQFDYEADLKSGARRMADQTGRLLETNDQLHETLDGVKGELAASRSREVSESTASSLPIPPIDDPAVDELERELRKFWTEDPVDGPRLSIVVVEFDDLRGPDNTSDRPASDMVISAAGRLLESGASSRRSLVLLPNDRFLVLLPDSDAHTAAETAERLRQLVHGASPDETASGVTIRCGVAETKADDSPRSLAERAEATLRKAGGMAEENVSTPSGG